MSDAETAEIRSDPRVIRRLNVIIALLVLPYVLFALDRFGGALFRIGVAGVAVAVAASLWYAFRPSLS